MAAGVAALALASPAPSSATGGGGPVAQSVLGSGDATNQYVQHSLDGLYLFSPGCAQIPTPSGPTPWLDFSCQSTNPAGTVLTENYEHDQAHEASSLGAANGIKQLCSQGQAGVAHIDFARSSRTPSSADCAGLHSVAYARDGVSWEAFDTGVGAGIHLMSNQAGTCAGSTGACLSQAQLQGIYLSCTITNWNQVGGANVPISIYTAAAGSGTRANWDTFLGGDSSACIPAGQRATHVISADSNVGIPSADQAGAIAPYSSGVWATRVPVGAPKLGSIDNVAATTTTVGNATFPSTNYLYNVYCTASCPGGASSTATTNYVGEEGWICKPSAGHGNNPITFNNYRTDIASKITAAGFVPLAPGVIGGGDTNSDFCRLTTSPPPVGDFDGDHRTDTSVFRPSDGNWYTNNSGGSAYSQVAWGQSTDVPVPADYDGTGRSQVAIYRPSTAQWFVRHANGTYTVTTWGAPGGSDVPVPADYEGAGKADIAIYRPSTGQWFVLKQDGSYTATAWGAAGGSDIPVPAAYDGTGKAQIAVFRPSTGGWYVLHVDGSYTLTAWGTPGGGDVPVPSDYQGNGRADIAIYRRSTGEWFVLKQDGSYTATVWGASGSNDIPQPGDFNGDGKTDLTVYRPGSPGTWYVLPSDGSTYTATQWGSAGDVPVVLPAAVRTPFLP